MPMKGWTLDAVKDRHLKINNHSPLKIKTTMQNHSGLPVADLERRTRRKSVGKKPFEPLDTQSNLLLHILSRRHRLADSDGISGKACIDGIVHSGILSSDGPKTIHDVTFSQEKIPMSETQMTIVEIWSSV